MLEIEEVIGRLRIDSNRKDFTGFIANAHVVNRSLQGEVWRHQRAEPSGRFADGHRIQTSRVIEVHTAGESVWVETESGSLYGILSFTALGLKDLLGLRDLDGFAHFVGFGIETFTVGRNAIPFDGSGIRLKEEGVKKRAPSSSKLLRPPINTEFVQQAKSLFERQLEDLKRSQREYADQEDDTDDGETGSPPPA